MQTTRFPVRSSIAERVTDFMSHLRGNGIPVGFVETDAAMRAFASTNLVDADATRMALKAICARNEDGFERFDELFTAFWLNRGREKSGTVRHDNIRNNASQRSNLSLGEDGTSSSSSGSQSEVDPDRTGEATAGGEGKLVASRISNLEKTDFRELMTPD